jgi:hypothetical protein
MRFYKRIGVELEGGWSVEPNAVVQHDGSVDLSDNNEAKTCITGEVVSKPGTLLQTIRFMNENYPPFVNNTCGFHIHISLADELYYSELMSKQFFDYFLEQANKWAKKRNFPRDDFIWQRLSGKIRYCQKIFAPEEQAWTKRKHGFEKRYSALNFCKKLHGTFEVRVWPMFPNKTDSYAALRATLAITNKFLGSQKMNPRWAEIINDDMHSTSENVTIKEELSCV